VEDDLPNFRALQGGLLVAPILQKLIVNREPLKVLEWVDKVSKWPIKRIIPCHLANDIKATGEDFKKAFDFLLEPEPEAPFPLSLFQPKKKPAPRGDPRDIKLLSDVSENLTKQGVLFPEAPLVPRSRR
jgi:hypothetical protein